jgi:hypothetical protein
MGSDAIFYVILSAMLALGTVIGVLLKRTLERERGQRLSAALRFKGEWRKIGGIPRISFKRQGVEAQVYVESSGVRPYVLRATHLEVLSAAPGKAFILASRDLPLAEESPSGLIRAELGEPKVDGRFALLAEDPEATKPLLLGRLRPLLQALDGVAQGNALVVSSHGRFRITVGRDLVQEDGLDLFVENGLSLFSELQTASS